MTPFLTAVGLGLGAGVNAYATMLVFGLLARFRPTLFEGDLAEFFSSTPVLVVVGALYVIEFFADKVPALDHAWDAIHTFVRPMAGALVGWASASQEMPQGLVMIASALAGGAALTTHATKASVRIASTATTAGTANPLLSLMEDLFAFVNAILAILLPWIVLVAIAFVAVVFFTASRRYRKRAI